MTQDEWRAIVKAWAAWVNGEGPPVQGRNAGPRWNSWEQSGSICSDYYREWRVKPLPLLARMIMRASGSVTVIMKACGEPAPPIKDGEEWIGDWQEIPE